MTSYAKRIGALIGAWLLFAIVASALQLFNNDSQRIGVAVALAAFIPILAFAVWYAGSARFREFALSLSPRTLTFLQSWRLLGLIFVILEAHHALPAVFALSAGYGDIFIGATAAAVAFTFVKAEHRTAFIAWQLLGMTDLITAVALGTTAPLLSPAGASMELMTVLPLSLVPTFLVPLFFMIHVLCIAQARRWKTLTGRAPRTSTAPAQAY